ncbi:MAG TPA: hypothetical protein VGE16_07040 [Albitalea sp.]
MPTRSPTSDHAACARVLAMMVAANGRVDEREVHALEELDAFRRLGVTRQRFVELARLCLRDIGAGLSARSWLTAADMIYLDALLDAVESPQQRLLVCRLAAAVITADGCVTLDERLVYGYALARWHIHQGMVTQAILHDRTH